MRPIFSSVNNAASGTRSRDQKTVKNAIKTVMVHALIILFVLDK